MRREPQPAAFVAALEREHNTKSNPKTANPKAQQRLREQAAAWLKRNDPNFKRDKKRAATKKRKDAEQAKRNPGLVAHYRKAFRL